MAEKYRDFSLIKDVAPYLFEIAGIAGLIRDLTSDYHYSNILQTIVHSPFFDMGLYIAGRYLNRKRLEEKILHKSKKNQ